VNTNKFLHIGVIKMLEVHKNYVLDENQQPIAVQIPIAEFEKIEEILEDYGLVKLMQEVEEEKPLSKDEALKYYQSLKEENVAS
jgi:RelB Antitoxin alpha helical domain